MDYTNKVNIYVRETKLTNVAGRINYATNQDVQKEKLLGVYGNDNPFFWEQLANENHEEFKKKGREGKCVEAREYVMAVPNTMTAAFLLSLKQTIDLLTGTDCLIAFHDSHAADSSTDEQHGDYHEDVEKKNKHVHIFVPERELLLQPDVKRAERKLYFDESGKRRYKAADVYQDGELRPGCRVVEKGEIYEKHFFGPKNEELKQNYWMRLVKQEMCDWINNTLQPDLKRIVHDDVLSPYIAQLKLGVGLPIEKNGNPYDKAEKRARKADYNQVVKDYNELIRAGRIDYDTAMNFKAIIMLSPDRAGEIQSISELMQTPFNADQLKERSVKERRDFASDKDYLKYLYKTAAELRKKGREATDSVDRKMFIGQARQVSAMIDLQRKQMGYFKIDDYRRVIERQSREAAYYRRLLKNYNEQLKNIRKNAKKAFLAVLQQVQNALDALSDWAKGHKVDRLMLSIQIGYLVINGYAPVEALQFDKYSPGEIRAMIDGHFKTQEKLYDDFISEVARNGQDSYTEIFKKREEIRSNYAETRAAIKNDKRELRAVAIRQEQRARRIDDRER